MVDLFGAAALRTDLEYLTPRPASLPSRILDDALRRSAALRALDRAPRDRARRAPAVALAARARDVEADDAHSRRARSSSTP